VRAFFFEHGLDFSLPFWVCFMFLSLSFVLCREIVLFSCLV